MSEVEAGASRKNRTIFLVILALFVLAWIGTTIFGFFIVDNVREAADRTDTDMRALAWASIVYACNNDGRFPSDDDELLSVDPLPESIACLPSTEGAWPTNREAALGGASSPDMALSLSRIVVHYSSDGTLPPAVDNNGLPTRLGTQDEIREWLAAFDEEKSAFAK